MESRSWVQAPGHVLAALGLLALTRILSVVRSTIRQLMILYHAWFNRYERIRPSLLTMTQYVAQKRRKNDPTDQVLLFLSGFCLGSVVVVVVS